MDIRNRPKKKAEKTVALGSLRDAECFRTPNDPKQVWIACSFRNGLERRVVSLEYGNSNFKRNELQVIKVEGYFDVVDWGGEVKPEQKPKAWQPLAKVNWGYLDRHGPTQNPHIATRREWWYDKGNTYVYQGRVLSSDNWGPVLGEFEKEGYPQWVAAALGNYFVSQGN